LVTTVVGAPPIVHITLPVWLKLKVTTNSSKLVCVMLTGVITALLLSITCTTGYALKLCVTVTEVVVVNG